MTMNFGQLGPVAAIGQGVAAAAAKSGRHFLQHPVKPALDLATAARVLDRLRLGGGRQPDGDSPGAPAASRLAGRRLLMVDDQQIVLDTVRPVLDAWDLQVTSTTDPNEALGRLLREDYDLLMTDLVMPDLDGVTLLNRLLDARRYVPTLVLSGSQGNRQSAYLLADLSRSPFRALNLPLLYMKKDPERFAEGLHERLLYLAGHRRFRAGGVRRYAIPRLRSVLVHEQAGATGERVRLEERHRSQMTQFVDLLLDARFALLHEAPSLLRGIDGFAAGLPAGHLRKILKGIAHDYPTIPRPERTDLLQLDSTGWHDHKNELMGYWVGVDGALYTISQDHLELPPPILAALQRLDALATRVVDIAQAIHHLLILTPNIGEVEPFKQVRAATSLFASRASQIEIPSEGGEPLKLRLSYLLVEDVLTVFFDNAIQATPAGLPAPSIRAAIVERPDASGVLKGHFLLAVTNHGGPIAVEVRDRMVGGVRFTTKRFGSGTGLALVHEYLRESGGRLEVESEGGRNTVAVVIPIEPNQPPPH